MSAVSPFPLTHKIILALLQFYRKRGLLSILTLKQIGSPAVQDHLLQEHACVEVIQGGSSAAKSASRPRLSTSALLPERLQALWVFYYWGIPGSKRGKGCILERWVIFTQGIEGFRKILTQVLTECFLRSHTQRPTLQFR